MTQTQYKIYKLISETTSIDIKSIRANKTFDDLDCDSLDFLNVVLNCESEFKIDMTDDELVKLKTVGDLTNLIESKTNVKKIEQDTQINSINGKLDKITQTIKQINQDSATRQSILNQHIAYKTK